MFLLPEPLAFLVLFLVTFIGNGIIPTPVTATIFWMGQYHHPVLTVLVACVGTLSGWVLTHRFLSKVVEKRPSLAEKIPEAYKRFFLRHTALSAFLFNAIPVPMDPVRLLATVEGYNPNKLAMAITLGRLVRYTLLVSMGQVLSHHQNWFVGGFIFLLILPILLVGLTRLRQFNPLLNPSFVNKTVASQTDFQDSDTVADSSHRVPNP